MTIADALNVLDRSVSARDAEVLLQSALNKGRSFLHTHPEYELSIEEAQTYANHLARREENEPVAYIIGSKEFYGRLFACDRRALIPRPETEGLIDRMKDLVPARFTAHTKATNKPCPQKILEIGTGSGNIAVSIAAELEALHIPAEIIATDISPEALALAQKNAQSLVPDQAVTRLTFIEADLFAHPLITEKAPFDIIVANLPYVPTSWKTDPAAQPDVVFYEPDLALFGGEDGLVHYRTFFAEVEQYLATDGVVLVEFGEIESGDIQQLVPKSIAGSVAVLKDYAELDRILEVHR